MGPGKRRHESPHRGMRESLINGDPSKSPLLPLSLSRPSVISAAFN